MMEWSREQPGPDTGENTHSGVGNGALIPARGFFIVGAKSCWVLEKKKNQRYVVQTFNLDGSFPVHSNEY